MTDRSGVSHWVRERGHSIPHHMGQQVWGFIFPFFKKNGTTVGLTVGENFGFLIFYFSLGISGQVSPSPFFFLQQRDRPQGREKGFSFFPPISSSGLFPFCFFFFCFLSRCVCYTDLLWSQLGSSQPCESCQGQDFSFVNSEAPLLPIFPF